MRYFLGLDIGTKNIKAAVLNDGGNIEEEVSTPVYDLINQPKAGFVERDPLALWKRVCDSLKKLKLKDKIEGVCVDATSGTIVPVDEAGTPLHNLIMYNDSRAVTEAEELRRSSSKAREFESFLPITPQLVLPKIMWMKKHCEFYGRIYKILHESDYIVYKLTGLFASSNNTAGKSHALLDRLKYLEEAYEDVGVPVDFMPELKPIGSIVGYVTENASVETGLPSGIPVVNGVTDASAGDITSGAIKAGQANATIGTALTVHVVVDKPVPDAFQRFYYKTYVNDLFLAGGFTNAGTTALDTMSRLLGRDLIELTDMARRVPPGCEGLIACTEWYGVRVPKTYPSVRGFFIGLSEITADPGVIFRSMLEGSALALKLMLDSVEDVTKIKVYDLRVSGGASKNDLFMSIIADVSGKDVYVVEEPNSAVGSAILAMWGCMGGEIEKIVGKVVKIRGRFKPNMENHVKYSSLLDKYVKLIENLAKIV
jgi:xylulokinase